MQGCGATRKNCKELTIMTDDTSIMQGLGSLFKEYVPKEYPYMDTHTKAYHYMQGAIEALSKMGLSEDKTRDILLGMATEKKSELEEWEYVSIVCGDIFHV